MDIFFIFMIYAFLKKSFIYTGKYNLALLPFFFVTQDYTILESPIIRVSLFFYFTYHVVYTEKKARV